jgi:hypothetical protein
MRMRLNTVLETEMNITKNKKKKKERKPVTREHNNNNNNNNNGDDDGFVQNLWRECFLSYIILFCCIDVTAQMISIS